MHEYSIMVDIVKAALESIKDYEIENVEKVFLDVGELMFLNPEQLEFSFKVLTEENFLNGADLVIEEKKAEVECTSCGYKGHLPNKTEEDHFRIPRIFCPRCKGAVNLLSGRECIVRRIHMNVKEKNGGSAQNDGKIQTQG